MDDEHSPGDSFLALAGWLFADVFLGLAMLYFAIGTTVPTAAAIPPTPTRSVTPTPTSTMSPTFRSGTTASASPTGTATPTRSPSPSASPSATPVCQEVLFKTPVKFNLFERDPKGRKQRLIAGDEAIRREVADGFTEAFRLKLNETGMSAEEVMNAPVGFLIIDGNSTGENTGIGQVYSREAFKAIKSLVPAASRAISLEDGTHFKDPAVEQVDRLMFTAFRLQRECGENQ